MGDHRKRDGYGADELTSQGHGERVLFLGAKRALAGGVLAGSIALGGQWFIGQVYSGAEALRLIEAMVPSARAVGSSVVTASGTILALMLTMLSLTNQTERTSFGSIFFKRIERIGQLSTIALATGILLLLLLSIPLQESQNVPSSWFRGVYFVLISLTAALAGLLVAIVLMLMNAMTSLIAVVRPRRRGDDEGAAPSAFSSGDQEGRKQPAASRAASDQRPPR
jgi:uncharacterized integral membrane protein